METDSRVNLYGFQRRFLEDSSPFRKVVKSRQIGFSFIAALEGYTSTLEDGQETDYISASEDQAKELLAHVRRFMSIDRTRAKVNNVNEIVLPNNGIIRSLPCTAKTSRGFSPKRLYLDELAHWTHDEEIWQAVAPSLTRTDKERRLTVISTPLGKRGKFFDVWENHNWYSAHKVDLYEAIKDGCPVDIERCHQLVPDDIAFRQEFLCEFVDEATSYFPYDLIMPCVDHNLTNDSLDQLQARTGSLYSGYDPAKLVDSGVYTIVERNDREIVIRHIKEWQGVSYSEQERYINMMTQATSISKLLTDSTGVGVKIQEDLEGSLGARAEGITFTNAIKEQIITDLRVAFQDRTIRIPHDMKLITQLHGLQRSISDAGATKYQHEENKHDDYVWSLALALRAIKASPTFRVQTVSTTTANAVNPMRAYERADGSIY